MQSTDAPELAATERAYLLDELVAANPSVTTTSDGAHYLLEVAAEYGITLHEWLHVHVTSQVGIAEHEAEGLARHGVHTTAWRTRMFEVSIGDGGEWDW